MYLSSSAHVRRPKTGVEDDHVDRIVFLVPAHLNHDLAALNALHAYETTLITSAKDRALAVPMRFERWSMTAKRRPKSMRAIATKKI